jgi:hypothetical protein
MHEIFFISGEDFALNEQWAVYLGGCGQYFTRNDYGVKNGKLKICKERLKAESTWYTKQRFNHQYKIR